MMSEGRAASPVPAALSRARVLRLQASQGGRYGAVRPSSAQEKPDGMPCRCPALQGARIPASCSRSVHAAWALSAASIAVCSFCGKAFALPVARQAGTAFRRGHGAAHDRAARQERRAYFPALPAGGVCSALFSSDCKCFFRLSLTSGRLRPARSWARPRSLSLR